MAQYYNFVTNASGTFTLEEVPAICSLDGQSVQLVVEDINNGVNGSQQILTYTAAAQNCDQPVLSPQSINLGSQISTTQLEQGQNVFIIKTNELSANDNNILKSTTVNDNIISENTLEIVDNKGSKTLSRCNDDGQGIPWVNMQENSINLNTVSKQNILLSEKSQTPNLNRNQLQNNLTPQITLQGNCIASLHTGQVKRKPFRLHINKNRNSLGNAQTGPSSVSPEGVNVTTSTPNRLQSANVPNTRLPTPSFRIRTINSPGQNVTQIPPQQIRSTPLHTGTVPRSQMSKTPLRLQQAEMDRLSDSIKQAKLKQMQGQRQIQNEQRSQSITPQRLQHTKITQQPSLSSPVQRQKVATNMQQKQQQMSLQKQISTPQKVSYEQDSSLPTPPHGTGASMDIESPHHASQERGQTTESCSPTQTDSDSASESIAYLQKIIDNPANTIIQHQIQGNTAKMLVMLTNGEQRLITFDIPNEDCTVQDLLEQAKITFCGETIVSLVSDPALGINYIVEAGPGTLMTSHEINDSSDGTPSQGGTNTSFDSSCQGIRSPDGPSSPLPLNEEPIFVEGMLAVCTYCGMSSVDFNRCLRCKTKFTKDVKAVPMKMGTPERKDNALPVDTFYKKSGERNSTGKLEKLDRDGMVCKRGRGRGRGASSRTRPIHKEPECLTISSDEEEEGKKNTDSANNSLNSNDTTNNCNDEMDTIFDKEPVITNNSISNTSFDYSSQNDDIAKDNSVQAPHTSILCRTVRIGSYKYVPREKVVISQNGVKFSVPLLEDDKSFVTLDVKFRDIVKVLIHFGKSMPVLFFYTSPSTGAMIRELLGMQDPKGPYYDPAGKDHTHKRITLLPEKLTEESKVILKSLFLQGDLLAELNPKEANDILVRASPKDSLQVQSLSKRQSLSSQSTLNTSSNANGGIQTITVYPPPPAKGGIAINTEDYLCLGEDQFLNDVIIDFYLKYLTLEILSESDHQRTHVFSSYFYKRLTSPHAQAAESNVPLSPAAKRHARVQKWTKNVNIFEKDFIIIPINEHAHWFLAIICFPGLVGKVPINTAVSNEDDIQKTVQKSKKLKEMKLKTVTIGSTTITPVRTTITIDPTDDGSERDEAEGDDEEMEVESDEDEEMENMEENKPQATKPEQGAPQGNDTVKVPCILIFDSLAGASRSRVVATLRDYLSCEHVAKMGSEKIFSKDTIKGSSLKVPQQSNFTDCGLYVLQYVESFFQSPIKNYTLPIKALKHWFEEIVVTRKREELSKLLIKLMNSTKGDKNINLPSVNFPTQDGKLKVKVENHIDVKPTKQEIDVKKKPTVDGENRISNAMSTSTETTESANEIINRTTYQIIPYSPCTSSNSTDSNPTDSQTESKTPVTRSPSDTMSYLKSKRIARLMLRTENQDDSQSAKKHKGESFDSCK